MSKHAVAVHLLEMAIRRLDLTLAAMEAEGKKDTDKYRELTEVRAALQDSIETLEAVGWVEDRAAEIRARPDKPQDPSKN